MLNHFYIQTFKDLQADLDKLLNRKVESYKKTAVNQTPFHFFYHSPSRVINKLNPESRILKPALSKHPFLPFYQSISFTSHQQAQPRK